MDGGMSGIGERAPLTAGRPRVLGVSHNLLKLGELVLVALLP